MEFATIDSLRNVLFFAEQYASELPTIGDNEQLAAELLADIARVTAWLDKGGN